MSKPPNVKGHSKIYNSKIASTSALFKTVLLPMPVLGVTQKQINVGTDSLKGNWAKIVKGVFEFVLHYDNYELSYTQINIAFWWAIKASNKLEIIDIE